MEKLEHETVFCVISHTHWDREWYLPFEQFRIKLVSLIDGLLEILRKQPEYVFHLDAQTIVLEDYLEIRPYMKDVLKEHIRSGRILVGPWYVQNDFFLTSGEATIRNLLIGSRMAEEMGGCSWTGYAADQFGIISQLPQIFRGFGIDNFVFARGYNRWKREGSEAVPDFGRTEFTWRGADGSEVDAFFMAFWYNNAQRFSADISKSVALVEKIERDFRGLTDVPYLLCMNGVDHLEPQADLSEILRKLNRELGGEKRVEQYTFDRYIRNYRNYRKQNPQLCEHEIWEGELREGAGNQILHGTLSSRSYLKQQNHEAQNLLEDRLEPLYSMLHLLGFTRACPGDFLRYLWKLLIQNHAHDSICGCSADAVHDHMEDRSQRIRESGNFLLAQGLDMLGEHICRDGMNSSDYLLILVNTLQQARRAVVTAEVQFPASEKVAAFTIHDTEGSELPFVVLGHERMIRNVQSPINLPGNIEVDSYLCRIESGEVPAFGYSTLTVRPITAAQEGFGRQPEKTEAGLPLVLENEYLTIRIHESGRVDLIDARTGVTREDVLFLEDSEDCGDVYLYKEGPVPERLLSSELQPEIELVERNELFAAVKLSFPWLLPAEYDRSTDRRSGKRALNRVELTLSLARHEPFLRLDISIENASRDHRIRLGLRTGVAGEETVAASPFDLIRRSRQKEFEDIRGRVEPFAGLLIIRNEEERFAVFSEGINAYEHDADDASLLYLTLLRSNKYIFKDFDGVNMRNDLWQAHGNQCLRRTELKAALYPFPASPDPEEALPLMRSFHTPFLSTYQPVDFRKFRGGRPGVQDPAIQEIFFEPDPYPEVKLARVSSSCEIYGENTVITCLKESEKESMIVVRACNYSERTGSLSLRAFRPPVRVCRLNLKEEILEELPVSGGVPLQFSLGPKEIVTIGVVVS